MFGWIDQGEESQEEDGLFLCRTEDKTRTQYRSKVNVLCSIVQDPHESLCTTYKHLVREDGESKTFKMALVKGLSKKSQKYLWTKLLNVIAEDPKYAKSQVCRGCVK